MKQQLQQQRVKQQLQCDLQLPLPGMMINDLKKLWQRCGGSLSESRDGCQKKFSRTELVQLLQAFKQREFSVLLTPSADK